MKIFISYRRADSKYVVDRIRDRLIVAYGEQSVFRDIESIPLGKNFSTVLDDETNGCNAMLVVIGPQWADIRDVQGNKRLLDPGDFTRIEIETGLKREEILVIPVLVMNAVMPATQDLPQSLSDLAYLNGISVRNDPDFDHDIQRLISSMNKTLGGPAKMKREYFEPETIYIPEGKFWMGSAPSESIPDHETPIHEVFLPAYYIGQYPVQNQEYEEFVRQTGKSVDPRMGWNAQRVPSGEEKLPVTGVSWYDALQYCEWLSSKTGRAYTLPNEAQWDKACRGSNNSFFPWGDEFDPTRCNHGRSSLAPVDAYPAQNKYGGFDFVGNVRQWTCSLWGEVRVSPDVKYAYPWKDDRRNELTANRQIRRVVRGSSMKDAVNGLRSSARCGESPEERGLPGTRHSFRVVLKV